MCSGVQGPDEVKRKYSTLFHSNVIAWRFKALSIGKRSERWILNSLRPLGAFKQRQREMDVGMWKAFTVTPRGAIQVVSPRGGCQAKRDPSVYSGFPIGRISSEFSHTAGSCTLFMVQLWQQSFRIFYLFLP